MILDTNAWSAFADGDARAIGQIARARAIAVPVIVLGEYRFGFAQSRRRADCERWLAKFLASCRVPLAPTLNGSRLARRRGLY